MTSSGALSRSPWLLGWSRFLEKVSCAITTAAMMPIFVDASVKIARSGLFCFGSTVRGFNVLSVSFRHLSEFNSRSDSMCW